MPDDLHCPSCRHPLVPPLNRFEEGEPRDCGMCGAPFVVVDGEAHLVEDDAEEA